MASERRFTVFSDENQTSQKVPSATVNKRAPLSVLSATNRGSRLAAALTKLPASAAVASNTSTAAAKATAAATDKENITTRETVAKKTELVKPSTSVNDKENQVVRPKLIPKEEISKPGAENDDKDEARTQRVPFKVLDEVMFSPASVGSPMVVSPMPESVQQAERDGSPIVEDLFDDKFFTEQYGDTHFAYMKELEVELRARADYMTRQKDISSSMRGVLVDWLVEVNEEYDMSDETLFLAVSLIDRFLSVMSVVRSKLQLVGTAAMLVASKVEEIYPPELAQFVYVTDDTYTGSQIIRMEALLLNTLGFKLGAAHSLTFVRRLAVKAKVSQKVAHRAQYLCELSLSTDASLMFKPSEIAAGAMVLALDQTNDSLELWTDEVERYADVDKLTLKQVVGFLHKLLMQAGQSQHQATQHKYCHLRFHHVAAGSPKPEQPQLI